NRRGKACYEGYLNDRVVPIPELLQDAGYRTYMAGKWHLGAAPEHSPAARGFDRSFDLIHGSGSHFPNVPVTLYREDGEPVDSLPDDFYSTEFYTDKLIEYIEESRASGAPWFGYLAYTSPHWPLQVPSDWRDRYAGDYDEGYDSVRLERIERAFEQGVISSQAIDMPATAFARRWADLNPDERRQYARAMEIYASMVENLDHHVGRLVDYLESTGQRGDTVIVFMSDNGAENFDLDYADRAPRKPASVNNALENFGNPDSFILYGPGWAQAGMGPYSRHKGTLADGGIRAAALINHNSVADRGETEDTLLTVRDLSATLLDIAGAQHPGGSEFASLEGVSFLPLLTGSNTDPADRLLFWEHDGQVALVQGGWKYRRLESPHGPSGAAPGWQLFNLIEDPGETTDVSDQHPELVAEFSDAWADLVSAGEMIVYPE
ncbi:MAG: sulfatase-like hydrolase/transferase, partial [Pseudomonadota bacterium]